MNPIDYVLQLGNPRFGPGMHPWFGIFPVIGILISLGFLAAVVYVAWKVGAYYDAARKKL
jgi:hypothetical protein